ncbi:TPA: dimethyl sulfoxide reductase subunit B [Campylobacter jejuni]|uniref:4Fe-4S dicluster domain-containing protein n=1 Tax=Campylobacter jejuni TaxID=197 RepID=UPI0012C94A85|nr:dimethyl sulfoxide reductase subunit B [Campylobacter jejuni]ECO5652918.1 dimethyl sulfoxide reductase subunit B [Campylobacter jejuni]ECP9572024.1 dimethyl sulfoxide reductase subunit B [Campylobacter jejuni]ECQ5759012.1 dimethyl sulfoxide reductase subunit B [Campylobacter jejuni]ECQ6164052.1 dimethyl sulfoxide reductase subunit B [Campylobacter jejuni]
MKLEENSQFGFMLDQSKCVGCRTCSLSCKDYKNMPVGVNFRRVFETEGGNWTAKEDGSFEQNVFAYYTSISCNHCSNPSCLKACAMACPYGAPQFNYESGHMSKCDGCYERLKEGKNPICVDSCPFRALKAGDITKLREEHGNLASITPLPDASITHPNLCIVPEKHSLPSGNKSAIFHLPQNYQGVKNDII